MAEASPQWNWTAGLDVSCCPAHHKVICLGKQLRHVLRSLQMMHAALWFIPGRALVHACSHGLDGHETRM